MYTSVPSKESMTMMSEEVGRNYARANEKKSTYNKMNKMKRRKIVHTLPEIISI